MSADHKKLVPSHFRWGTAIFQLKGVGLGLGEENRSFKTESKAPSTKNVDKRGARGHSLYVGTRCFTEHRFRGANMVDCGR